MKLDGLTSYLTKRARLRFFYAGQTSAQKSIFGKAVSLDLRDLEQKYLAEDCVREPENLFVYKALKEFDLVTTFIDIGANCGHVAASIVNHYGHLVLFEPNPKLTELLRSIFQSFDNVEIKECAIVGSDSIGKISLSVPEESSGLATLGGTHLSNTRDKFNTYEVRASTLESETEGVNLASSYIKVDVEGFEYQVISSARELLRKSRPIIGFEALSLDAARKCCALFDDCKFYCARFDFLEPGGALTNSIIGMVRAIFSGGNIEVIEINPADGVKLENFSQVYAVPNEKSERFEGALRMYSEKIGKWNLSSLKTWSSVSSY